MLPGQFITNEICKQPKVHQVNKDCENFSTNGPEVIPTHSTNGHSTDDGMNKVENRAKPMSNDAKQAIPNHKEQEMDKPNQTEKK